MVRVVTLPPSEYVYRLQSTTMQRAYLYLALSTLLCTGGLAQTEAIVAAEQTLDSLTLQDTVNYDTWQLLTAAPWQEVDGKLLVLSPEGNFDEAARAGISGESHLLGRWVLDSTQRLLTLSVDGFMSGGKINARYRKGRDFYLPYEIVEVTPYELVLLDLITKKRRSFIAAPDAEIEDHSERRKPVPTEAPVFKLPTLGDFD